MKLSIITCTYNSEKYLQETINSVVFQNLDTNLYEHIFIDGFSIDKTINIINKYISENPNKNIILNQKTAKGIYNAMNEGIKMAKGEYILLLHSDDYLEPNALEKYLDFIEETGNLDLYYAKFNAVSKTGKIIYNAPLRKIYQKGLNKFLLGIICYINQPTVIHKKSLHDKFGYFNEKLKVISDWEFWIILAKNKVSNIFYNNTVNNFRVHELGTSNNKNNSKISEIEFEELLDKYYGIEKYISKIANYVYKKIPLKKKHSI